MDKIQCESHYQKLIDARNFHYENFSKWTTFFYVAIGALFVAYYSISNNNLNDSNSVLMKWLVACLGYVVSLFLYWSSKGYYYWNIHWINLIHQFENENINNLGGRIYTVFSNKDNNNDYFSPVSGANISTSKITLLFGFTVAMVWGIFIAYHLFSSCDCERGVIYFLSILLSLVATYLFSLVPRLFLRSDISMLKDLKYYPK